MKTPPADTCATEAPDGPSAALPAKQARSRELRDRLIASGRALLESGGFASTSMADIARAAGCSVGALYFRFRDKEALFDCVVEVALQRWFEGLQARVAAGHYVGRTLHGTVDVCVDDYIDLIQGNAALIRAVYQRTFDDPHRWALVRRTAVPTVATWVDAIAQCAGRAGDEAFIRQVRVAFQFVGGVLVHAVLVDPPLLKLQSEELRYWLRDTARHLVAASPPPAG